MHCRCPFCGEQTERLGRSLMNSSTRIVIAAAGIRPALGGGFVKRCCTFYLCALIGLWIFSIGGTYVGARLLNQSVSVKSFFFANSGDRFRDFTNFDPATGRYAPRGFAPGVPYPPATEGTYIVFARFLGGNLPSYLMFICLSVVEAAVLLIWALTASGENRWLLAGVVAATTVLSYPLMFLLERA